MAKRARRIVPLRTVAERDKIVLQYLFLVKRVVNHVFKNFPSVRDRIGNFEDAESAGYVALIHAAELWDASRGAKFMTYAWRAIWSAVLREADDSGAIHVPSATAHEQVASRRRGGKPKRSQELMDKAAIAAKCTPLDHTEVDETLAFDDSEKPDYEDLFAAMDVLSDRQKQVISYLYGFVLIGDQSHQGVARFLGLPVQKVVDTERESLELMRARMESMK